MTIMKCGTCGKIGQAHQKSAFARYQCGLCGVVNEVVDITVTEWLGFNYQEFLRDIDKAIDKDKFSQLAAQTAQEAQLGKLTANQIDTLKNTLKEAFNKGESIRDIAARLRDEVGLGDLFKFKDDKKVVKMKEEPRSVMVARSEITRIAARGAEINYRKGGVTEYSWVSTVSSRTDDICLDLNGQVFEVGRGVVPPAHPNCRCTIAPVVPELEAL